MERHPMADHDQTGMITYLLKCLRIPQEELLGEGCLGFPPGLVAAVTGLDLGKRI